MISLILKFSVNWFKFLQKQFLPKHLWGRMALCGLRGLKMQSAVELNPPGLKLPEMLQVPLFGTSSSVRKCTLWFWLKNCPGLIQGVDMHGDCFSTWAHVLALLCASPFLSFSFRLGSASLPKGRYRGVGYLGGPAQAVLTQSPTRQVHQSLSAWGPLYSRCYLYNF